MRFYAYSMVLAFLAASCSPSFSLILAAIAYNDVSEQWYKGLQLSCSTKSVSFLHLAQHQSFYQLVLYLTYAYDHTIVIFDEIFRPVENVGGRKRGASVSSDELFGISSSPTAILPERSSLLL
jgi:hypothetical protein